MDDLINWNRDEVEISSPDEDEDNDENVHIADENASIEVKIKHYDAIKCLETCIQWSEQNNIQLSKSLVLRELQEEAVQKSLEINVKQTSINDFFK